MHHTPQGLYTVPFFGILLRTEKHSSFFASSLPSKQKKNSMKTQPTNKKIHVPSSGIPRVVINWIHTHCGTKIGYKNEIAALLTNNTKVVDFLKK